MDNITKLFYDKFSQLGIVNSVEYKERLTTHVTIGGEQLPTSIEHEVSMSIEASNRTAADVIKIDPFELGDLVWRLSDFQTSLDSREHLRRKVLNMYIDFKA